MSGQVTTTKFAVRDVFYSVHKKRGAPDDAPRTMRVDYKVGWHDYKSEWVCVEHYGYARRKAEQWWRRRSRVPIPSTAQEAVDIANSGGLAFTTSITIRTVAGDEFERIIDSEIGPMPAGEIGDEPDEITPVGAGSVDLADVPF